MLFLHGMCVYSDVTLCVTNDVCSNLSAATDMHHSCSVYHLLTL